jgi:ring-1,2-phenylacetyl-CoA epoxidase subunit PaaD
VNDRSVVSDRSVVTGVDAVLEAVPDPELPYLTIADLGILRGWQVEGDTVRVQITPTYSGCPALDVIRDDIEKALHENGFARVEVETVLSPAWTTDWLSERGRVALAENGIAPPGRSRAAVFLPVPDVDGARSPLRVGVPDPEGGDQLRCPHCGSRDTEEQARFGSTACKALHRCLACREPFEHFKAY